MPKAKTANQLFHIMITILSWKRQILLSTQQQQQQQQQQESKSKNCTVHILLVIIMCRNKQYIVKTSSSYQLLWTNIDAAIYLSAAVLCTVDQYRYNVLAHLKAENWVKKCPNYFCHLNLLRLVSLRGKIQEFVLSQKSWLKADVMNLLTTGSPMFT